MTRNRINGNGGAAVASSVDAAVAAEMARMNDEFAVVRIGDRPMVMVRPVGDDAPLVDLMSFGGFRDWLLPRTVRVGGKEARVADLWLKSPDRRQYRGICFAPGAAAEGAPRDCFNLWRGFAVRPDEAAHAAGRHRRFLEHVAENICQGDETHFAWLLGWAAKLVQRPHVKTGTSPVFRGQQGTGKTIVGRTLGRLLGAHYRLVASSRFVVGRFNSHLAGCLLLQADEGFWAGDKAAEGTLKDLVTGHDMQIEYKGREPVTVENYVRLLITGNDEWLVPAGLEERRFAVFDVHERRRGDRAYFGAIARDMTELGGDGALLHHLLTLDTADIPDEVPRTAALLDQKLRSLSAEGQWWLDVLSSGKLPGDADGVGVCRVDALYHHYVEHAKAVGERRRATETALGAFLRKWVPGRRRVRRTFGLERAWGYEFPPLAECRRAFCVKAHYDMDWPGEADDAEAVWTPNAAAPATGGRPP